MSARRRYLPIILLLALIAARASAQPADTAARAPRVDSAAPASGYVMTKSPTTAILLSIIPGGGQFYNEQYWKVPLFAGAAGYFLWRVIYFHNLYKDKSSEADIAAKTSGLSSSLYQSLKLQREGYRDDRDLHAAYFLAVEVLGMIDAYVGAHMFDFDVGDDISSRIYLTPVNPGIGVQMRW